MALSPYVRLQALLGRVLEMYAASHKHSQPKFTDLSRMRGFQATPSCEDSRFVTKKTFFHCNCRHRISKGAYLPVHPCTLMSVWSLMGAIVLKLDFQANSLNQGIQFLEPLRVGHQPRPLVRRSI